MTPAALAQIYAHARAAFPHECCGYVTAADRVVACTNADASGTSFAIDGRELFDLVRSFASPDPARVIYHSHPNGRAYLSPTDRRLALTDARTPIYPVDHVVVGVAAAGVVEAARFTFRDGDYVEIARYAP